MNVERPFPREDLEFVRREFAESWRFLKRSRFLVTGATGFFGRWMLESLLHMEGREGIGIKIEALSRDPEAFLRRVPHLAHPSVTWTRGSVTTLDPDAYSAKRFDILIHLATESDLQAARDDPGTANDVITGGTRRALEVARRTLVQRFLFTSTGAVYGRQPEGMERVPEEYEGSFDPLDPQSRYASTAWTKREAEILCAEKTRLGDLPTVIARCFSFAGPGLPTGSKFALAISSGTGSGEAIVVKGDGTAVRSYLYAADLVVWLLTLLVHGQPARIYNVGSEHPVSMMELARGVSSEFGGMPVDVLQKGRPGAPVDRYVPSTERARSEFGLRENFTMPEIIRRTAAWSRPEVKH